MKTILAFLFLFALAAPARDISLAWDDPDNAPGEVHHYEVWIKAPGAQAYTHVADAAPPTMTATVSVTQKGRYEAYVTAVDAVGLASDPSNILLFRLLGPVRNVRLP